MSLKQHTTSRINGFQPPVFPQSLAGLIDIVSRLGGPELDVVSKTLPGFTESAMDLVASDGYLWYRCLFFRVSGGDICVTVPWSQDWEKSDGNQSDRSPAVYISSPDIPNAEVDGILELLTTKLREYYAELERKLKESPSPAPDV